MTHEESSCFAVQGIIGIWVAQELRQEDLKYIYHVCNSIVSFSGHPGAEADDRAGMNSPNIGDQVWLITSRQTEPLLARR